MSKVAELEHLLSAAGTGWDFFDGVPDAIRKRVELQDAKSEEDRRIVSAAWAAFAETPGGRKALEALFDTTLRRTVYFVNLGQEPGAMAMWGAFREGQNAVAHAIAVQISRGRETDEQPKPRDV